MKTYKVKVEGMTCSSCEVLVERGLKKVEGVDKVKVSRSKETAEIKCKDGIELEELQAAVSDKGYVLIPKDTIENPVRAPFIVRNKKRYAEIGAVVAILVGLYFILKQLSFLPDVGVTDNMSYGFVFVIGLVAATSTCLAVAGGLLLAVANKYNKAYPNLTSRQKMTPHAYFNAGRIVSYVVLGGLVGALGGFLSISPAVTGWITIAASVFMIIMGIQLLQIFPWMNKIQIKMPKFVAHKLYERSLSERKGPSKIGAFMFGGSTFFLPCGFTQALQLYVLGKGDFMVGALTMLAFSLGTLPALAGIGAFTSVVKGKAQKHFTTVSAVLVIILGVFAMPNGMALAGLGIADSGPGESVGLVGGFQEVHMKVDGMEYYPANFEVVQGVPVRWVIDGTKAVGCARVIVAQEAGITEYLSTDKETIIEFIPEKTGKIPFSCSMGMTTPGAGFTVIANTQGVQGASLVVEDPKVCDPTLQNCNVQKVQMEISNEKGFHPNYFEVQKGVPVEMEIDAKVVPGGCMGIMVVPKYDVTHKIVKGKQSFSFTPTEEGMVPVTCSMGSPQAQFRVI